MRDRDQPWDHEVGKVRVLSRRCDTCIFWPDDRSAVDQKVAQEVIQRNLDNDALLNCHSTLREVLPDFGPAVCAGFWASHKRRVRAARFALAFIGIIRVDPPTDEQEER